MKTRFLHFLAILCALSTFTASLVAQNAKTDATATSAAEQAVAKWPANDGFPGKGAVGNSDWFKKTWATRRTEFWNHRKQDKGAVVFLGDSITQGWKTLASDFPNLKVANRGISGDFTRSVWYRLDEDVLNLKPAAIVLLIGTNDIGLGGEVEDTAENIKSILTAMEKRYPKMPVIICKVMPSNAFMKRPADKIQKLNTLVDDIIKDKPHFVRCDTYSIFANDKGDAKKEEFPDLLHPNAIGYGKWKAALDPIFAQLKLAKAAKK